MNVMSSKLWAWGYVLDHVPSAAPFCHIRTKCSLERAAAYLGINQCFYMNSMFSSQYLRKNFPDTQEDCFTNCIDGRLSENHFSLLGSMQNIYCTLEHEAYEKSAREIAKLSLTHPAIVGVNLDDFNDGTPATKFTHDSLKALKDSILEINPKLKMAVVTYSHLPVKEQIAPYADLIDVCSRWRWVSSMDYWDNHKDDIKEMREALGPGKQIIQGIYLHDFGSGMKCRYPVPLDRFKKSFSTCLENIYDGVLDGLIIPSAALFSSPDHYEHVTWMKQYLEWFDGTADLR